MAQRSLHAAPADDEDDYRAQVAGYPRLSADEEQRLLAARGAGRDSANRRLIEHNLSLVFEAAHKRKGRGVPFGDLFQEGTVGLISAVEHYRDSAPGFTATLRRAITTTMDEVLAQTTEAQWNDEAFVTAVRLVEAAQRLLSGRLERPATAPELAKLLQWEETRVNLMLQVLENAGNIHDQELLDYLYDLDIEV